MSVLASGPLAGVWWVLSDEWVVFLLRWKRCDCLLWFFVQFVVSGVLSCCSALPSVLDWCSLHWVGRLVQHFSLLLLICFDSGGRHEVAKMEFMWEIGLLVTKLWGGFDVPTREVATVEVLVLAGPVVFSYALFCHVCDSLHTSIVVGSYNGVVFNPTTVEIGDPTTAFWQRVMSSNGFFIIRFLCFGLVFLFGLISPYSLEIGLGFKVGSWLWCFSWRLIVSISICYCR